MCNTSIILTNNYQVCKYCATVSTQNNNLIKYNLKKYFYMRLKYTFFSYFCRLHSFKCRIQYYFKVLVYL